MKENPIWTKVFRVIGDWRLWEYNWEDSSFVRDVWWNNNDIEVLTKKVVDERYPTIKNSNKFKEFANNLLGGISRDNSQFAGWDENCPYNNQKPIPQNKSEEIPEVQEDEDVRQD